MKLKIFAILIPISLMAAACTPKSPAPANNVSSANSNQPEMKGEAQVENADLSKAGSYKDYSPATVAAEQKAGKKVVLFFHAPWCPFCRAADAAFKANLGKIPSGVTILKTDYDSNTDLKKKYCVTYQHTFVQIDNSGNQVSKWNGGDIDNVIKYVK